MHTSDEFKRLLRRIGASGRLSRDELSDRLTRREMEVVQRLANGQSTGEIAHGMAIRVTTVNTHVHNIVRKLMPPPNNGGAGVREPRKTPPSGGYTWGFENEPRG